MKPGIPIRDVPRGILTAQPIPHLYYNFLKTRSLKIEQSETSPSEREGAKCQETEWQDISQQYVLKPKEQQFGIKGKCALLLFPPSM